MDIVNLRDLSEVGNRVPLTYTLPLAKCTETWMGQKQCSQIDVQCWKLRPNCINSC